LAAEHWDRAQERIFTGVMTRDRRTGEIAVRGAIGELPGQQMVDRLTDDPGVEIIEIVVALEGSRDAREFYLGESAV